MDTRIKKLKIICMMQLFYLLQINSLNLNEYVTEILPTNDMLPSAGQGDYSLTIKRR